MSTIEPDQAVEPGIAQRAAPLVGGVIGAFGYRTLGESPTR